MSRELYEKYSDLIDEQNAIKIPAGWETIVQEMLEAVKVYEMMEVDKPDYTPTSFTKIKNNNGWLDIEYNGGDYVVDEIARFARILSFKKCEICGIMNSKVYCSTKWMHWSYKKTLCKTHAIELYYYRIE
tara:strand:+ start:964 stop:1353 length:390 start_codon:yes stop_codon:yes gene_type:complete